VSPFKGLAAFQDSELDALFFFGRERERAILVANLQAFPLTVLYGESGVGKSSLLGAAVVRDLRETTDERITLVSSWSGELEELPEDGYLILDQFEEYFLYHAVDDAGSLGEVLPRLLDSHVHVLISLREDALARLDAFKARVPGVFANQVRLDHLEVAQARQAILGPLARWRELTGEHVDADPALVSGAIEQVAVGSGRVEAPYLQLVLERVWAAEREAGSSLLRGETLDRLGGASAIVRDQFHGALDSLPPEEQAVAAAMLEHLVTPTGTKIALRTADLAAYADVPEPALVRVLDRLTRDRVVRSVDGSDRYEIFHDVLAEPVSAWRLERRLLLERAAARRRQRRLYAGFGVALAALVVLAGLAVWAFSERRTAQDQAHHAKARELEATALQYLTIDPSRSVRAGLRAARLEPGPAAEDVLRQALVADRLRLVEQEPGAIAGVAVSPSSRLVAVAVRGFGVRLRDGDTGRLVHEFRGVDASGGVSFTRDGRRVVAAARNGSASIWTVDGARVPAPDTVAAHLPDGTFALVRARRALGRALRHANGVVASPDGRFVVAAVAHANGRVRPWVFDRAGRRIRVLPEIGIKALAFSPSAPVLAAASADGSTVLWSTRTWKPARTLADSKQGAGSIAFSPDGTFLATGGADSGVRIWTVASGERTYFLFGHVNPVTSVAWSPDGRVVASGSLDRTVHLWRVRTAVGSGSQAAVLPGDTEGVAALAFTPDSTRLVSGSDDHTVRWWAAAPDEELRLLGRASGSAVAARWQGDTIAAAWSSGVVQLWDGRTLGRAHVLARAGAEYTTLALSRDGSTAAAGRADGVVDLLRDGEPAAEARLPASVAAVDVDAHGEQVVAATAHGRAALFDGDGGERWHTARPGTVAAVAFSPSGKLVAVCGAGGTSLLAAATGRAVHELGPSGGDRRAAFSPDGRYVATAGEDGKVRLWAVASGRLRRVLHAGAAIVNDVTFSADGRFVAASSADAEVRVWNVATGRGHRLARSAFGSTPAVAFDRTGKWVVAAAPISAIVWRADSGRQLFYLRGHGPLVTSAVFAPDRPTILTASGDGTVRTYACEVCGDLPALVRLAERRLAATR
jgi:WD40 repeat protein